MATFGACQKSRARLPYLMGLGTKGPATRSSLVITFEQAIQKRNQMRNSAPILKESTVPITCTQLIHIQNPPYIYKTQLNKNWFLFKLNTNQVNFRGTAERTYSILVCELADATH